MHQEFIGILLFSGYHTVPSERQYWSSDDDLGVELVKKCMPKNRFCEIKQNLHLNDNSKSQNQKDKIYKIRPL